MPPSPVLLLILALVVPPPAASFRPQHPPREFGQLDRDADSSVSLEEVESHLDARLEAEIDAFLAFFDADGGGSVTAAEYGAKAGQFFDTDPRTEEWFWRSLMPHPPPDDESTLCVSPVQRRLGAGWLTGMWGVCSVVSADVLRSKRSLLLTATAQEAARKVRRRPCSPKP